MKRYIDAVQCKGFFGIVMDETDDDGKPIEIIFAGTIVDSTPAHERNEEYQKLEEKGVWVIYDDNIPLIDFYTVPVIHIFAEDRHGGYWGIVKADNDTEPIAYIDRNKDTFKAASCMEEFLFPIETIVERSKNLKPMPGIAFFHSVQEAKEHYKFLEIKDLT